VANEAVAGRRLDPVGELVGAGPAISTLFAQWIAYLTIKYTLTEPVFFGRLMTPEFTRNSFSLTSEARGSRT
jgi:hypothetical protein